MISTPESCRAAFKEWASIVQALGNGEQILIFRKGGIADAEGLFEPSHSWFFLFPTWEHQKTEDLNARGKEILKSLPSAPPSKIQIEFLVHLEKSLWIEKWEKAISLNNDHVWSESSLNKKFFTGSKPGLFLLLVKVFRLKSAVTIPPSLSYGGCRSWIQLENLVELPPVHPVLHENDYQTKKQNLEEFLSRP